MTPLKRVEAILRGEMPDRVPLNYGGARCEVYTICIPSGAWMERPIKDEEVYSRTTQPVLRVNGGTLFGSI